jgi:hypothetical protein
LNQTIYDAPAVTGRGITIGDTLDEVISAYKIKTDYAMWEARLNPQSDGSFTIESRKYVSGEFNENGVQKATLIIGYYRLETQWIPLTYDEINQYIAFLTGETNQKPYDGILIYQFQFPFNDSDKSKTLAEFTVDLATE